MKPSEVLKQVVEQKIAKGKETRYSVAKGAGVHYATFVRWLDEDRDIRASTIDALAAYLGLELRPVRPGAAAKRKKK